MRKPHMNKTKTQLLFLSSVPTVVLIAYGAWDLMGPKTLGIGFLLPVALTSGSSFLIAFFIDWHLVNPITRLTTQLKKNTNVASGPLTELSIAIDMYVTHLEEEYHGQINQIRNEKKRLSSLLKIAEQTSAEAAQHAELQSTDTQREQTFLRYIHQMCIPPLKSIIGLTNRIAVDPKSEDISEELAAYAEKLRFLINETLGIDPGDSKQIIEPRQEIDDILTLVQPMCVQKSIDIHSLVSERVPNTIHIEDERFRSLVFNYILHYLTHEEPQRTVRLEVDYSGEALQIYLARNQYPAGIPCARFKMLLDDVESIQSLSTPAKEHSHDRSLPAQGLTAVIVSDNEIQRECLTIRLQSLGMNIISDFKSRQLDACFVNDEASDTFRIVQQYLSPNVVLFFLNNQTLYNIPNWIQLKNPLNQSELLQHLHRLDSLKPEEHPNMKVLAVDDSKPNLQLLVLQLEELGHQVTTANTCIEAVELCQLHEFDLIFMDIQIPELDGVEATRSIRLLGNTQPKIIGLTAHISPDEQKRCIEAGMDEVIIKPMRIATIRAVTKSQHDSAKPPVLANRRFEENLFDLELSLSAANNRPELADELFTLLVTSLPLDQQSINEAFNTSGPDDFRAAVRRGTLLWCSSPG